MQRLGIELPGQTIAGDCFNPDGYFEWDAVVDLQERLLIDLQRWWPSDQGALPLPSDWRQHPATRKTYKGLLELLSSVVHQQRGTWAIKDPRCSRLLPLWSELCDELDIPLRLVLAVRDPAEVVTSLVNRDGSTVGMDSLRAQHLWWVHNMEPIAAAQQLQLPLAVINFDLWFEKPQYQLEVLINSLKGFCPSDQQMHQALQLINPQHRRSNPTQSSISLQPSVRRLYRRLIRQPFPTRWPASQPPFSCNQFGPSSFSLFSGQTDVWNSWLKSHHSFPAPRLTTNVLLDTQFQISVCGSSWLDLRPHLLLQRLPLVELNQCSVDFDRSGLHQLWLIQSLHNSETSLPDSNYITRITINLELPEQERASDWLDHLHDQQLIFDPEPARVLLLRSLGLPAWWLDSSEETNGWLQQSQAVDSRQWAARLGLSPPPYGQLLVLGSGGSFFEQALTHEMSSSIDLVSEPSAPAIAYWPGWFDLVIDDVATGILRAGWLQSAAQRGARLVMAGANNCPPEWDLLQSIVPPLTHPLDATPAELRARHAGQPLIAFFEDRTTSCPQVLCQWKAPDLLERPPLAAVAVSLHNYADRITEALESVRAQTQQRLELVIVDDASTDDGKVVVQSWIDSCLGSGDHPFVRVLFLRHCNNFGLAAARNTALSNTEAAWFFVLDADNALFPDAVACCLELAQDGDSKLAVVHPLLAVEAESGRPDDQRSLVSSASWQRESFLMGNVVDAMALVRRSAWEAVGGYTHIEGGWEDYDFWCKLVEADYYGLQCPRILAIYRSHAESMSYRSTNRSWYALSRTLQKRHPWLNLPLAQSEDA